jgi:IclR helix-turn-helix domain
MAKRAIKTTDITTPQEFEKAVGDILTGKATYMSDNQHPDGHTLLPGSRPRMKKATAQPEAQVPVDPKAPHAKRNAARKATEGTSDPKYAGTVTVNGKTYPARITNAGIAQRNRKADGTGQWIKFDTNAHTFEKVEPAKAAKHTERRPVIEEDGKFYRVRGNGTRRAVPLLEGTALAQAQAIRASRDGANGQPPMTVREIADSLHMSTSTVRRLLVSLELTEQHLTAKKGKAQAS